MQSNAKVGGILSIISGAFSVFWLACILLMFLVMTNESLYPDITEMSADFSRIMLIFYSIFGGFFVILGILAIIGGIFALRRKIWGLALTGAIAGTFVFFPCGIPAIIFVSLGKQEFVLPVPPAPTV